MILPDKYFHQIRFFHITLAHFCEKETQRRDFAKVFITFCLNFIPGNTLHKSILMVRCTVTDIDGDKILNETRREKFPRESYLQTFSDKITLFPDNSRRIQKIPKNALFSRLFVTYEPFVSKCIKKTRVFFYTRAIGNQPLIGLS